MLQKNELVPKFNQESKGGYLGTMALRNSLTLLARHHQTLYRFAPTVVKAENQYVNSSFSLQHQVYVLFQKTNLIHPKTITSYDFILGFRFVTRVTRICRSIWE